MFCALFGIIHRRTCNKICKNCFLLIHSVDQSASVFRDETTVAHCNYAQPHCALPWVCFNAATHIYLYLIMPSVSHWWLQWVWWMPERVMHIAGQYKPCTATPSTLASNGEQGTYFKRPRFIALSVLPSWCCFRCSDELHIVCTDLILNCNKPWKHLLLTV